MTGTTKKLIVDEKSKWFDIKDMKYKAFNSRYKKIREYALSLIKNMPEKFKEKNLLEQQLSEMIKNAIEHGNKNDPRKKVKVWYKARRTGRKYVHFIVEDEGEGFKNIDEWNEFYQKRNYYIEQQDFENMIKFINYRGPDSSEMDGGNALFAAIEYWNGGMRYNDKRNKVSVVRYFK